MNTHTTNILHDSNKIKIITDEPSMQGVLDFDKYSKSLANIIENSRPRLTVGVFGGWGTGKTTLMKMIKAELEKNKNILPVWFDAWRYEREENLAIVPFLRAITITLQNSKSGIGPWGDVKRGIERTCNAFIESSKISSTFGTKSIETNLQDFVNSLRAEGRTWLNDKFIHFHEHATDYFASNLAKLQDQTPGSRIVVFVDDLDRCNPTKALEVLESLKSFFDIEGLICVIGMNYSSINTIIKEKYGDNSNITGFDYMKKIIQLPFQIPDWIESDISKFIDTTISRELDGSALSDKFKENRLMLLKAVESNPREVKRFINNIILAKAIFDKPLENLIVLQALKFRPEWNKFLDFVTPDKRRDEFLNAYSNLSLDMQALKEFEDIILKIYPSFLDSNDPLRVFLDAGGAKYLHNIRNMEEHRRALSAVDLQFKTRKNGRIGTSSSYLLMLLRQENIVEFNTVRKESNFSNLDLSEADLGGRDMQGADLRGAILTKAYLAGANLSQANLNRAFLSHARLERSNLFRANLEHAYLHYAELVQSVLQEANLVGANLTSANCKSANLLGADMKYVSLNNVDFEGANLEDVKNLSISKEEALLKRRGVKSSQWAPGWD